MKKYQNGLRLASLLILAAMAVSCGDSTPTETPDTASADTAAVTESVTESLRGDRIASSLPEDMDLGGEAVRIWYFTQAGSSIEKCVNIAGDAEGDIVDVAMYDTNRQIEEDLNVTLDFYGADVASGSTGDTIRQLAMAAEDLYDIYTVCQWNAVMLAAEHMFLNLSDAPYLDYEKPWWSKSYIDACAVGKNNMYFLAGDVSLDMIRCISAFYFNKNMLTRLDFDENELYQSALDGTWTVDRMMEYANEAYQDINGSGKSDLGDTFGLLVNTANGPDNLSFGLGLQLTARDADHYPILVDDQEHNADVFAKMQQVLMDSQSVCFNTAEDTDKLSCFVQGNALFLGGYLYTAENLRDMTDDFGILPYPKYDETQENYISIMHDITSLMCVPTTNSKFDTTCAVLEALSYYNYYNVTPIYYDSALKVKYSRDDITPQVIDLVRNSVTTDISYIYIEAFNDLGRIMRTTSNYKNYASVYARSSKAAQKKMEKFIEAFDEVIE